MGHSRVQSSTMVNIRITFPTHAITHEIDRPPLIRPPRCRAGYRSVPADPPPISALARDDGTNNAHLGTTPRYCTARMVYRSRLLNPPHPELTVSPGKWRCVSCCYVRNLACDLLAKITSFGGLSYEMRFC